MYKSINFCARDITPDHCFAASQLKREISPNRRLDVKTGLNCDPASNITRMGDISSKICQLRIFPVACTYIVDRKRMARLTGLEPATSGVTGRHSNQLSYNRIQCCLIVARLTGLEPATSGVTGRHSNQLSYNRSYQTNADHRGQRVRRVLGARPATVKRDCRPNLPNKTKNRS